MSGDDVLVFQADGLPGERVNVLVQLPVELVQKIDAYARRHNELPAWVVEQAMTRALREQKL